MTEESWETLEEFQASLAPWIAYLVTSDGEFVEIGRSDDMDEAEGLRHDYFMKVLAEGHPHRFFRVMGITSESVLPLVFTDHDVKST